MHNLSLNLLLVVAILMLGAAFATIIWLSRVIPPHIKGKYTTRVLLKCKFPYPSNWESLVEPADVPLFRKYRRIFLSWYAIAAALLIVWLLMLQNILQNI